MMETVESLCSVAHVASEDEVRGSLQRLSPKARRLGSFGILAGCHRAIKSNPDVGACRAFLEQPEIRQNVNNVNVQAENFSTLLHAAVVRGADIVRLLLALPEVDLNLVCSRDRLNPLHLACFLSRSEVAKLLLDDRRVDLNATTLDCRTALHFACEDGNTIVVRMLVKAAATTNCTRFLNARDSRGRTALHYACENDHTAVVEELLDDTGASEAASIEMRDSRGCMAVHLAAQNGHREVVRLLLRRAPHTLDSQDDEALTPLHHAVRGGRLHILQDWISSPNPSLQESMKTFIEFLQITTRYDVAVLVLTELDQQLQASSPTRRNAKSQLRWAIESRSGYGAILIPHILKWQPHLANELVDQERIQTPLHVATISGQLDVVHALCMEQGWSLRANRKDKYNKTALDYAHDLNYKHLAEHLTERADVKEHITKLQKERDAYVAGANAILVVAVLIAGASFVSCVKPVDQSLDPSLPQSAPTIPLHLMTQTTFLTSMAATCLGACASLPFSFGLYTGYSRCHRDYIGHKVGRVRVLVVLASYFLVSSFSSMVFSFLCASEFGVDAAARTLLACKVFTVILASVTLLVLAAYFGRAHYCKSKQLAWRHRVSLASSMFPDTGVIV